MNFVVNFSYYSRVGRTPCYIAWMISLQLIFKIVASKRSRLSMRMYRELPVAVSLSKLYKRCWGNVFLLKVFCTFLVDCARFVLFRSINTKHKAAYQFIIGGIAMALAVVYYWQSFRFASVSLQNDTGQSTRVY